MILLYLISEHLLSNWSYTLIQLIIIIQFFILTYYLNNYMIQLLKQHRNNNNNNADDNNFLLPSSFGNHQSCVLKHMGSKWTRHEDEVLNHQRKDLCDVDPVEWLQRYLHEDPDGSGMLSTADVYVSRQWIRSGCAFPRTQDTADISLCLWNITRFYF